MSFGAGKGNRDPAPTVGSKKMLGKQLKAKKKVKPKAELTPERLTPPPTSATAPFQTWLANKLSIDLSFSAEINLQLGSASDRHGLFRYVDPKIAMDPAFADVYGPIRPGEQIQCLEKDSEQFTNRRLVSIPSRGLFIQLWTAFDTREPVIPACASRDLSLMLSSPWAYNLCSPFFNAWQGTDLATWHLLPQPQQKPHRWILRQRKLR